MGLYSATKKKDRTISPSGGNSTKEQEDVISPLPPPMTAWYALLFGGQGYYFIPLMISYAFGLFMANLAVYLMDMGQPALLYIVPCTLGTMVCKGWKRSELISLWEGPKVLKHADNVCYGRPSSSPTAEGEAIEDNSADESMAAEENFIDDVTGDVPLVSSNNNYPLRNNLE